MTTDPFSPPAGSNLATEDLITAATECLERFRKACDVGGLPDLPALNDWVYPLPQELKGDVLIDLVSEHLKRSWETGACLTLEDYLAEFGQAFPDFESPRSLPIDLVELEFIVRYEFPGNSDYPPVDLYRQRFPGRQDVVEQIESRLLDAGRYVKIRLQGQGGLGLVWLAYDRHLKRYVALKELNPAVPAERAALARLAEEARITAGLDHPAIVAVHELRQADDEQIFYVMRLVSGRTLRTFIYDYHANASGRDASAQGVLCGKLLHSFATICDGIAYAHANGVMHRDLKPDNVILGSFGEAVVLDWGLAKQVGRTDSETANTSGPTASPASRLLEGDTPRGQPGQSGLSTPVEGTPHYMAPEQARGISDPRSDIFGLGAILYEILTGRPPYQPEGNEDTKRMRARVRDASYARPRAEIARGRALEAICLKSIAPRPEDRYASAGEFAEDVRRWLADEPVSCYQDGPVERLRRLVRRRRTLAVAVVATIAVAIVILLAIGIGSVLIANGRAELALAKAEAAENEVGRLSVEAESAQERELRQKREVLLQRIQRLLLMARESGWAALAWRLIQECVELNREVRLVNDIKLRDQAAGVLAGLDVAPVHNFEFGAASVAFNSAGNQLLISGMESPPSRKSQRAKIWDSLTDNIHELDHDGEGPVAYRSDGTPLQLLVSSNQENLVLWDVAKGQKLRDFQVPEQKKEDPVARGRKFYAQELAGDGSIVAAVANLAQTGFTVHVWDTNSGKRLRRFTAATQTIALSPDGRLLAFSNEDGQIFIESALKDERIATFPSVRSKVNCLAFGRNARQPANGHSANTKWLLGAGELGGRITVWDLAPGAIRQVCTGARYSVYSLAFSPDGTLLASSGRHSTKLWDVASGQCLVTHVADDYQTGLSFSPDGSRLAIASQGIHVAPRVQILKLEYARGVHTFRGLSGPVQKVLLSPDSRLLAALGHDCRLAVWDTRTGLLLHINDAPKTELPDNAGLIFNTQGTRLAFASSDGYASTAKLWDTRDGHEIRTWDGLPPAMSIALAFHGPDMLLLCQTETKEGKVGPFGGFHPKDYPRVQRIRNLLSENPRKPLAEITSLNWHVHATYAAPDGSYFVIDGRHSDGGKPIRYNKVYDSMTGKELWSRPSQQLPQNDGNTMRVLDRRGKLLSLIYKVTPDGREEDAVVEMPSGKLVGFWEEVSARSDLPAELRYYRGPNPHPGGNAIMRRGDKDPLVTIGIDTPSSTQDWDMNENGTLFAWGNEDGTVTVCNLPEVRERLTAVGLGW